VLVILTRTVFDRRFFYGSSSVFDSRTLLEVHNLKMRNGKVSAVSSPSLSQFLELFLESELSQLLAPISGGSHGTNCP
jgi:hypothetical protein